MGAKKIVVGVKKYRKNKHRYNKARKWRDNYFHFLLKKVACPARTKKVTIKENLSHFLYKLN